MATCYTTSSSNSSSLSGNVLPQLLSKQRPFEYSRHDESFSEESSPLDDDYIFSDFKSLAAKDEKLCELLPHFEALKRVKCFMKTFLQEEATKFNIGIDQQTQKTSKIEVVVPLASVRFENIAELARLENRSFIFKLWLRRIELTRDEDKDKYTSLQDFEHAIYIAQESIKEYRDFIYKEYHNVEELQEMCPFYLERLEKASSKALEEKEKASFAMMEEDVVRFHCPKDRLCALLGLKINFLDRLDEMPEEHRHHQTLSDWIDIFLENNIESVTSTNQNSLSKELLASIGFDPLSTAVETIMARSFEGSSQNHIEACEWAEIFIKDEFKYNPLLSPLAVKFPFRSNLTNTWFQLPIITDKESENNDDLCHVNIMNLVTKELHASRDAHFTLDDFVPQGEENIVLFHGTDHQSAVDILFRGIQLCAGRKKRDFSCGSGFYLTKCLGDALNWAISTTTKPAILVFQVDREYFDDARNLNLHDNEERWREIVSSFRSGKRTARTRMSLSSYDLIEGPMATVMSIETSDELVFEPKPSSHQMCLISDEFAERFQNTLHSVLFFEIS